MQEKERFERYTPQYPLPVDISSMSRQDTICQFCGVSYLIHNEIKALEAKCQKLESDLLYYAGISSREEALEKSLQNERTRIIDFESTVAMNTHKINELTRKVQLAQDQLYHSQITHQQTKSSFCQCVSNIRAVSRQLEHIRREFSILKEFYSKEIHNHQTSFQSMKKEMQSTISQYTNQMNNYRAESEQQLSISNQSLHEVQVKYQESQRKAQADLEGAREEIRIRDKELSRLREHLTEIDQARVKLQNELARSEDHCRQLEGEISEKDQLNKHLDQSREQLTNERDLRLKTDSELEQLRVKLSQLTTEKKEFESNELNTRRKLDEINRSRQAVLDRTRDEYEKLLGKYNDLDEVYRELLVIREKDTVESTTIRRELERLHNENIELSKQKQTLHITHDVQMKKLHDSYAGQLRELEQWPVRLQEQLTNQREQHRVQMNELERCLTDTFTTELDIEKQKSVGLLRKYEHDSDHSRQKLRHELISTEKVTIEQRQFYEQQIEQLQGEKRSLQIELDTLRDVLKELHEQLSNKQMTNDDRMHIMTLKEDLLAKETNLFQSQTIITDLNKELQQTREEMITLQETVHKECTEREQLKDALIEARQQLLTLKKNGVLSGTASRSLHSPPIAFEDIERRVSGPLPFPHAQSQQFPSMVHNSNPSFVRSEPSTRDGSLPGDTADLVARPLSSSHHATYRNKTLPPIYPQQQQRRRNGSVSSTNKTEQSLENQRRIARFIKHIK